MCEVFAVSPHVCSPLYISNYLLSVTSDPPGSPPVPDPALLSSPLLLGLLEYSLYFALPDAGSQLRPLN